MNQNQRVIICVGFAVLALATIFPPWSGQQWTGDPIWSPPTAGLYSSVTQTVDMGKLLMSWAAIAFITVAALVLARQSGA